ncbi:Serine threonine- kinase CTR1 [Chlorella sorokiniana]|uniref:Serine threonine-kinase CTR1 n=1 Tax=Chlorella sorokiniana TaxID=3076 RepID=A0A2P6TGR4_CHLSO|nr:Serine threonine- kinase CTR1 [Chlorella sorokiniana]|eukprot:PRW33300.1 Serine threonine- kinase CTR1 [Chlorella sorokiniana]
MPLTTFYPNSSRLYPAFVDCGTVLEGDLVYVYRWQPNATTAGTLQLVITFPDTAEGRAAAQAMLEQAKAPGSKLTQSLAGATLQSGATTTVNAASVSLHSSTSKQAAQASSSVPIGAIVGGVAGGLAAAALVALGVWLARKKRKRLGLPDPAQEAPSAPAGAPPPEEAPPTDDGGCPAGPGNLPLSYISTMAADPSTPPPGLPSEPAEEPPEEGSDSDSLAGPVELPLSYITTLGTSGGEVDTFITPVRSSSVDMQEAAEAGSEPGTPSVHGASELDTFITPEPTGDAGAWSASAEPALRPSPFAGTEWEAVAGWLPPECTVINTFLATRREQLATLSAALASRASAASAAASAASGAARSMQGGLSAEVQQWEVAWEEITLKRLVGRGSFGWVYEGTWREIEVAVKVLMHRGDFSEGGLVMPDETLAQLQEEAEVMARMRHPAIVQFLGVCSLPACIITEFCRRGSLYDVLTKARKRPEAATQLTWELRLRMALDAATGLLYLHKHSPQPIVHRDIKSPNLLVDEHWRCKVCDFNLSAVVQARDAAAPGGATCNNPIWLAPEVLLGQEATTASDVYSFAMVLYELLTWQLPWSGAPPLRIARSVRLGQRPVVPPRDQLPTADAADEQFPGVVTYIRLMRECWAQAPHERPLFDSVVPRLRSLLELAASSRKPPEPVRYRTLEERPAWRF